MNCSELGEEIGKDKLQIGRVRRKLFPDHKGGLLSEEEIKAIKNHLKIVTEAELIEVIGLWGDSRYPNFIEATNDERTEKYVVQIPAGYEPENFLGRRIKVQRREYADGKFVYDYNPFSQ